MLVIKKVMHKTAFQLDLDIPSFSISPSGSYYRSEGLTFTTPDQREPNSVQPAKKSKKQKK